MEAVVIWWYGRLSFTFSSVYSLATLFGWKWINFSKIMNNTDTSLLHFLDSYRCLQSMWIRCCEAYDLMIQCIKKCEIELRRIKWYGNSLDSKCYCFVLLLEKKTGNGIIASARLLRNHIFGTSRICLWTGWLASASRTQTWVYLSMVVSFQAVCHSLRSKRRQAFIKNHEPEPRAVQY